MGILPISLKQTLEGRGFRIVDVMLRSITEFVHAASTCIGDSSPFPNAELQGINLRQVAIAQSMAQCF